MLLVVEIVESTAYVVTVTLFFQYRRTVKIQSTITLNLLKKKKSTKKLALTKSNDLDHPACSWLYLRTSFCSNYRKVVTYIIVNKHDSGHC